MASQHYFSNDFTGYGKTGVRLLKIKRISEKYHSIREVEVCVELKLNNKKDYLEGDNSSVIPTDTQKNTIYALATKNEVSWYDLVKLKGFTGLQESKVSCIMVINNRLPCICIFSSNEAYL